MRGSGGSDIFLTKYGPNGNPLWSIAGGTGGAESPCGIVMDSHGFIYIAGSSIFPPFWPGEVFLVKYDSLGNEIWVTWLGGGSSSMDWASALTIDKSDNIYITGQFSANSVSFGSFGLTGTAASNIFLIRCDTAGHVTKASATPNLNTSFSLWLQKSTGIVADTGGCVYLTGDFNCDSISVGSNTTLRRDTNNTSTLFIVKYDTALNPIWAKAMKGGNGLYGGLCIDRKNNVLFSGSFSNSVTLDTNTLTGSGAFVYKLRPSGQFALAKKIINGDNQGAYEVTQNSKKICTDSADNFFVTGYFNAATLVADAIVLNRVNATSIFVVKYDSSGNVAWARQGGSTGSCWTNGVECDTGGNVYITGCFGTQLTINSLSFQSTGAQDLFFAKYNKSGNLVYGKSCGSGIFKDESPFTICHDIQGNIYTSGRYSSDSIAFCNSWVTNGGAAFLAKYGPNGNCIWSKRRSWYYDDDVSMATDRQKNIFTVGGGYLVRKYDSSGVLLWQKNFTVSNLNPGNNYYPDVTIDSFGNVYMLGGFGADTLFVGSQILVKPTTYGTASFITKFDNQGNLIWAKVIMAAQYWGVHNFARNSLGEFLVTGEYYLGALFGTTSFTSPGAALFFARYDTSGTLVTANKYDNLNPRSEDICAGNNCKYFVGAFQDSLKLGSYTLVSNSGSHDIFIAKLNASDGVVWAKAFGGTGVDAPTNIAVDKKNNIYLSGNFSSPSLSFGTFNLTRTGNGASGFLAVLDTLGNPVTVKKVGDSLMGVGAMSIDTAGLVAIAGAFSSYSIDLDNNHLVNTDSGGTSSDIFIAKTCPLFLPHAHITGNATICQGDTAFLYTDSCTNCTYVWSTNDSTRRISTTVGGSYYVTVNNGCSNVQSSPVSISVHNIPVASITPNGTVSICQNDSVLLAGTNCPSCTYLWSTGSTQSQIYVSAPNSYYVVVTDSCGSDTSTTTIVRVNPSPPTPTVTQSDSILTCSSGLSYQWYLDGMMILGATNRSVTTMHNGTYTVRVTDSNGCSTTSVGVTIVVPNGIGNPKSIVFEIMPNPGTGVFSLKTNITIPSKVLVYNMHGKIMYQASMKQPEMQIDLSAQAKGIYFLQVQFGDKHMNNKLVIQ